MKTRYKILTSLLTPIAVTPAFFISTGCSENRYSKLSQQFLDSILEEFNEICKIYRQTFKTEEIARHINDRIYDMGLACYDDFSWVKKHKDKWAPGTEHTSGNLLAKVEASNGCEDWPTVILQAHMDMVCDGFEGGIITPVIEGDVLHTKDWKTSLGADNGIGLATLLTIIKYRDDFKHGPLRCIFTADEEDGEGCAHWIQDKWIDGADYMINLDHESIDDVGVSCAGVQQCKCSISLPLARTTEEEYKEYSGNYYRIKVWGANGGASGFALENNPIFPIKLAFDMIKEMYNAPLSLANNKHYIITDIRTDEVESNGSGSISQNATIEFLTNATEAGILDEALAKARDLVVKTRAKHPSEIQFKTLIEKITTTIPDHGIAPEQSRKVTKFFTDEGIFGEIKQEGQKNITTCSNAGPITVTESNEGKEVLTFETFGRSSLEKVLGPDPEEGGLLRGFMTYYMERIKTKFEIDYGDFSVTSIGWNPCWEETGSKFTDLYKQYGARNGKKVSDFRAMGWAETAEFVRKSTGIGTGEPIPASCIGPTIVDGHTKNGYCLVSSIKEFAERLIYGLENLTPEQ